MNLSAEFPPQLKDQTVNFDFDSFCHATFSHLFQVAGKKISKKELNQITITEFNLYEKQTYIQQR